MKTFGFVLSSLGQIYNKIVINRGWVPERRVEKLSRKQRIIIDLNKQNPSISKRMIEKQGDLSKKSVEYYIKKLKKMGLLKRVGPAKGGY